MLRRLRKNGEGFTLIELLIVVAIIGILAAIAIPNLLSATKKTKMSRALADSKIIVTQTQLYSNDFNKNPDPATLKTLEDAKYISQVFDPFGLNPSTQKYGYVAGNTETWALSVGPNAVDPSLVVTTWPAGVTNDSGDDCKGEVGWHNAYGAVQPIGGKPC